MAKNIISELAFSIETIDNQAANNFQKISSSISLLSNALKKIEKTSFEKFKTNFDILDRSVNKFITDIKGMEDISGFEQTAKSVSLLSNAVTKFSQIDMSNLGNQFLKLSDDITPFLNKLKENQLVLESFSKSLDFANILKNYDLATAKARYWEEKTKQQQANTKKINTQLEIAREKLKQISERVKNILAKNDKINAQTSYWNQKTLTQVENTKKTNAQLELTQRRLELLNDRQNQLNKRGNIWSTIWKVGKIAFAIRLVGRLGNNLANIINLSADFNETLNKFQSATQSYYKDSIRFVNKLSSSFGLAKQTIMEYQATFMNMLSAIDGVSGDVANKTSQNLTRFVIDYASLYNTSIERAAEAFQSMLAGRVTALRTTSGIDTTDQTIYEFYKSFGGKETLRSLGIIEKRFLRIYAVINQMTRSFAVGDYAETIESFSNQARILKEQLIELKTWIGNVFIGALQNVIPVVNGIVMALTQVIKSFAFMVGYKYQEPKESLLAVIESSAEEANEQVENLQESLGLLSIDKFDVLAGKSTSTTENSDLDLIQKNLNEQLLSLEEKMKLVETRASKISESILNWLGYTQTIDADTGDVIYQLKEGYQTIQRIANLIISIPETFILGKITNYFLGLSVSIKLAEKSTAKFTSGFNLLNRVITTSGIFMLSYAITTLSKDWDKLNIGQRTSLIILGLLGTALIFYGSKLKYTAEILAKTTKTTEAFIKALKTQISSYNILSLTISGAVIGGMALYLKYLDRIPSTARIVIGSIMTLAGAFTALAVSIMAVRSALSWGTAIPAILAGITAGATGIISIISGTKSKVNGYASGGFVDTGDFFIANESGPEYVGSIGRHKNAVANEGQLVGAFEQALLDSDIINSQNKEVKIVIDGSRINDSALVRALMPAIRTENKRTGGNRI